MNEDRGRPQYDCEPVKIDNMTGLPYGEIPGPRDDRPWQEAEPLPNDFDRKF